MIQEKFDRESYIVSFVKGEVAVKAFDVPLPVRF